MAANRQYFTHWYAFLAGIDILWEEKHKLDFLSSRTLSAAFAFSLLLQTTDEEGKGLPDYAREWSRRILHDWPDIARESFRTLLTERLRKQAEINSLLRGLPDQEVAPWRSELAIQELILDYEPRSLSDLQML